MKLAAIALALSTTLAAPALAQGVTPDDPAFGAAVRDYLLANPEILVEMQTALEQREAAEQEARQVSVLADEAERLFRSPSDVVLGNPDGDVTIVEFFDYNCGVCRRALADMQDVIESDPNVRFVLKEWPILGPASMEAHMVSRAVGEIAPERYAEFHLALIGADGRADGDSAMALADRMGLDSASLEQAMADPATAAPLEEAYELATALGINGTPSYVVRDGVFFGAVGADALKERIEKLRSDATSVDG